MRFCLIAGFAGLAVLSLPAAAADAALRSVVRVDQRTGKLVRTVKAPPAEARPVFREFVKDTAERYAVDPLLVESVIETESAYNPLAVSPKGAAGLMQLMPATARQLKVRNSFDPWDNIDGGVRYLKYLLTMFGDPSLAVAAYNAGEGAVLKHNGIPPYPETAAYVRKVDRKLKQAKKAAAPPAPRAAEAAYAPLRQYVDSEGIVHLETLPVP